MVRPPIVTEALRLLESHFFPRVYFSLLWPFITLSADRKATAKYIIEQSRKEGALLRIATTLQELAYHYRNTASQLPEIPHEIASAIISREGGRCCITKTHPSSWWLGANKVSVRYVLPPTFFAEPRMAKGGDFAELMDLMFTKPRVDELRSIAEGSGQERPSTENLWYISDKAEITIRLGALRMDLTKDHLNQFPDQQAYKISLTGVIDCPLLTTNEGKSLAADKDPHYATFPKNSTVKPPSPALIDFLKRIASLTHAIGVEEKRRRGGYYTWFDGLIQAPVGLYRWIFRIIPNSLRRHVYAILFRAGIYLYGAPGLLSGPVQRVPFGLYIKHGSPQRLLSEEAALKLIEQETNIPAPRHIDTYISTEGKIYMIMTRIPGQQLKSVLFSLSTEELKTLRQDLVRLIAQLRRVRNKSFPLICNVLGEGIKYHWDSDTRSGPFNAEADFDNFMLHKLSETRRQKLGTIISNNVVLTHGDLHSANIIMLNGRLSGVVDWELTGWMPAYWEYLKMERLSLHQAEEILLRPEKVFERFGEDWTSLVWRQDEIWSSLR